MMPDPFHPSFQAGWMFGITVLVFLIWWKLNRIEDEVKNDRGIT